VQQQVADNPEVTEKVVRSLATALLLVARGRPGLRTGPAR